MKTAHLLRLFAFVPALVSAHPWHAGGGEDKIVFDEAYRARLLAEFTQGHQKQPMQSSQTFVASQSSGPALLRTAAMAVAAAQSAPSQAAPFMSFSPQVNTRWDTDFLYIESTGLPAHNMMVGITAWQQQVPLPQSYTGDNAWRIPLHPVPAKKPAIVEGHFLRGAIALAVNGIPIFNPQNNRGEVSYEIGELDQWGGHCGRADDYHYHIAPLHLQAAAGKGQPIAYALDGYPIYGLTEPDGSPVGKLDECHGHELGKAGYHYHASTKRPYLQSAFHGEVVEAEGQVDPQPRAQPVREAGAPLRGAKITGFERSSNGRGFVLQYAVGSAKGEVRVSNESEGAYKFQFVNAAGPKTEETYRAGGRREGPGPGGKGKGERKGPPRGEGPPPRPGDAPPSRPGATASDSPSIIAPKGSGRMVLRSSEIGADGVLPIDYSGDGSGATLPLEWKGAPAGTQSYALIMDHRDPEGVMKWYWTLYDIPANVTSLPKNVKGVGRVGTGFKGQVGYEPPHSKGPGAKTYTLTMYALSAAPKIDAPASQVNREVLMAAIKDSILDLASLDVTYTRDGSSTVASNDRGPKREPMRSTEPASQPPPPRPAENGPGAPQGGPRKPWLQQHGAEIDADKDGIITLTELAADMNRAFAVYDTNKDGLITKAELDATGDVRDGAAFAGMIYRHFADLDMNGDGNVSRDEMVAAAKYIFNAADLDHDGNLTTAEWQSAPNTPLPIGSGGGPGSGAPPPPPPVAAAPSAAEQPLPMRASDSNGQPRPRGDGKGKGGGKGGPDNKGLIKPTMADTMKVNVYADNWFVLFINGKLRAVDSIEFTPHNVVTVDILPEYPMTIAIMAKDNADPKTGLEYGDHVGDGGFIIKFADGTVSNASWKAKNFFKGPLNHDTKNPVVEHTPIPEKWWTVDFDDSKWPNATEYTEERVNPKEPFYNADFSGAKFIWSEDLDLDNTVIFRTKVDKPGWKPRWNTRPDLDISEAPFK